ncbi:hypothetical protein [uncultured Paraglaciecola sp.]|uniref:hypothetical protein n=1 Tax=uncultured Paraglaciecola sp. TaxID=1765024 RepID=UPI002603606A|nr:hypothetical protein [uncultured Paraglaciecola sp.]
MHSIDYSKFSLDELLDVKSNIDKALYSERYKALLSEISKREKQAQALSFDMSENKAITPTQLEQVNGHQFNYFEGEYRCTFKRVMVVNAIGLFFGGIVSLMSKEPSSASSLDFGLFALFECMTFACLVTTLYTGKSLSNSGIVNIKRHYIYVTISQIMWSYLFFLGLIIGLKQFA